MKFISSAILLFSLLSLSAQETPSLETYSLKNGLRIYFIKFGKIEAMNLSIIINSGKKNEAPGQEGYNSLTANMVLKGNKKFSEDQQNDKAFAIGTELSARSNFDYTTIRANFLTKDADTVFDLISSAILQPSFDKEKISQYVSYLIDYNNPSKMDIAAIAGIYSNLCLFGIENPLGRNIYKKQLQLVTAAKLQEFHQFNYTPKNTKIIVCGNFNSERVKKIIENSFGAWQSTFGEVNGVSLEYPAVKKQEYYFVNRTGATQCALRWNKIGPSLKDKDLMAFTIANQLFNLVLFREIREIGGKTYGIGSIHAPSQFSNLLYTGCSVRNDEMLNTINLFDKTLQNFSLANFTKQEFDNEIAKYKTDLIGMEYPEQVVSFYNPILYNFESRKNAAKDIDNIKMEDVQKAVKKYFTPNIYKLVISGDESVVKEQLAKIKDLKKYGPADLELKN